MEYINTGLKPNDGTADSIKAGFDKANMNFELINNIVKHKQPFKTVKWDTMADTKKCADDMNYNFKLIEKLISLTKIN